MIINIIIFIVAIILAFSMLNYRAWKIQTAQSFATENIYINEIKIPFRRVEKVLKHLTRRGIQIVVVFFAKYWFIVVIKTKKKANEVWPRIHDYLVRKKLANKTGNIFLKRIMAESKMRIRYVREKVKRENGVE